MVLENKQKEAMSNSSRTPALTARWINGLFAGALIVTCVLAQTDQPGPPCLFRRVFHLPCPGCGLTRSFKAVWRGEWLYALRLHPLGPFCFLLCALFLLVALFQRRLSNTPFAMPRLYAWLLRKSTRLTLIALMLGVWIVKLCLLFAYAHSIDSPWTRFLIYGD